MNAISSHELAIWISIFAGGGVAVVLSLGVAVSEALRKPDQSDS
jgi:hypothetical protein